MDERTDRRQQSAPRLAEGIDVRALPIGPHEAFVLSRVDGRAEVDEIASATGLDVGRVRDIIRRLTALGAIWSDEPAPAAEQDSAAGEAPNEPVLAEIDDADPELDEDVDLDRLKRKRVLAWFRKLDSLTHYEILNLRVNADKKAIKAAYYDIVAAYHPDRFFGKRLGSYKPKLDRIFERLTAAHDTLTRRKAREAYDDELKAAGRWLLPSQPAPQPTTPPPAAQPPVQPVPSASAGPVRPSVAAAPDPEA